VQVQLGPTVAAVESKDMDFNVEINEVFNKQQSVPDEWFVFGRDQVRFSSRRPDIVIEVLHGCPYSSRQILGKIP
jgi:hypothetical protein